MDRILASEVTVNPRFGRRSWVKLWVNEWLDGTTRYEMSDSQRAFWIDLLAMAGRSRYPGIICAGKSPDNKYIGYPINKFQSLMSEPINVEQTLEMFVRTGKISVEVTSESPKLLKLELVNWGKFQSEYQRQKPYRNAPKLQRSDSHSYKKGNKTEVEVDSEVEVEVEREVEGETSGAFLSFWNEYPRQEKKIRAKFAWFKNGLEARSAEVLASLTDWKRCEQWSDPKFIPYAVNWIEEGLWKQNPYVAKKKESLHEQLNKLGAKP